MKAICSLAGTVVRDRSGTLHAIDIGRRDYRVPSGTTSQPGLVRVVALIMISVDFHEVGRNIFRASLVDEDSRELSDPISHEVDIYSTDHPYLIALDHDFSIPGAGKYFLEIQINQEIQDRRPISVLV